MEPIVTTPTPGGSEADAARLMPQRNDGPVGDSVGGTSVPTDTGRNEDDQQETERAEFGYSPAQRAAIDEANEALAPIIEAVKALENIEAWVPPVVKGVRALRERAIQETGARNCLDHQYRRRFGDLLKAEPFGSWLLDKNRRSVLDAVHYLGSDETYLDSFLEWWRTKLTDEQRRKWRELRTLVDHFKERRGGKVARTDRRTPDQKEIEAVRTEGHKADAALVVQVAQARRELATQTIENTDTLWTVIDQAGVEMVAQCLKEHTDFALALYNLLSAQFQETTA